MSPSPPKDPIATYLSVLQEIGLSAEEVRSLHASGEEESDSAETLRRFVADRVDADDPETLTARLIDVLSQSRRGMSVTGSYWNYAPEVHLNEVFEPYGCTVTFRDASHGTRSSFEVALEDAGGTAHRMDFEYPDTALEDDNFPALLRAIETRLLSSTDLTFVLLQPIDRRWRVLLIDQDRLTRLRERYGERIECVGRPLLRAEQPPAFEDGDVPPVKPHLGETQAGTGRNRSTVDRRKRPDASDAALARATGRVENPTMSSIDATAEPDAVFGGSPDELAAASGDDEPNSTNNPIEATDNELATVFGDLSGVSLEPIQPESSADTEYSVEDTVELGEQTDDVEVESDTEPDGIDVLFEQIERAALTDDHTAVPSDSGGSTLVASGGGGPAVTEPVRDELDSESQDKKSADSVFQDGERADPDPETVPDLAALIDEATESLEAATENDAAIDDENRDVGTSESDGEDGTDVTAEASDHDSFQWVDESDIESRS